MISRSGGGQVEGRRPEIPSERIVGRGEYDRVVGRRLEVGDVAGVGVASGSVERSITTIYRRDTILAVETVPLVRGVPVAAAAATGLRGDRGSESGISGSVSTAIPVFAVSAEAEFSRQRRAAGQSDARRRSRQRRSSSIVEPRVEAPSAYSIDHRFRIVGVVVSGVQRMGRRRGRVQVRSRVTQFRRADRPRIEALGIVHRRQNVVRVIGGGDGGSCARYWPVVLRRNLRRNRARLSLFRRTLHRVHRRFRVALDDLGALGHLSLQFGNVSRAQRLLHDYLVAGDAGAMRHLRQTFHQLAGQILVRRRRRGIGFRRISLGRSVPERVLRYLGQIELQIVPVRSLRVPLNFRRFVVVGFRLDRFLLGMVVGSSLLALVSRFRPKSVFFRVTDLRATGRHF